MKTANSYRSIVTIHSYFAVSCLVAFLGFMSPRFVVASLGSHVPSNPEENLISNVSVSQTEWHTDDPQPTVTLELAVAEDRELDILPSLHLQSEAQQKGQRREYWAPFDLTSGRTTKESQPTKIQHGSPRSFQAFPMKLKWAKVSSSVWPDASLPETVPPGKYRLRVDLTFKDGRTVSSKEVTVTISR